MDILPDLSDYGYADGDYDVSCWRCGQRFTGDKRANTCVLCAMDQMTKHFNARLSRVREKYGLEPPSEQEGE